MKSRGLGDVYKRQVINPHLIMIDSIAGTTVNWLPITAALPTIVTALIGTVCLAGTVESYLFGNLRIWQRIILLLAAFALLDPKLLTDAIGLAALALIYVTQKILNKNKPAAAA